jgi:TRAP-type mannitol/chloroaromatic compound transport system permease large subunit
MEIFLIHNMAPIMFGSLVVFLLLGYPAAFSLGASCKRCPSAFTA